MSDNQLAQISKSVDRQSRTMERQFAAMDKKFEAVNDRFDAMDKKFDDQFAKLFKYMSGEFSQIHRQLDETATKAELNTYVNAVDAYMKRTEIYHHEMLALGHKVDRHEKWHERTAKAVGIKLSA